jgi:flagellar biosynthesis protein FliQ
MNLPDALEIIREALWVTLKISMPLLLIALTVGLVVSLFQALTQIQETTLSFVPKIITIFAGMVVFLPFMFITLKTFTFEIFQRIAAG